MEKEDRIKLRDEIHTILRSLSILITHKNGTDSIHRRSHLTRELQNNLELKEKYNLYVQQFRSEEEAIYCIIHLDDPENHKCIICGNLCKFYEHNCNNKYKTTCEKEECIQKMIHSDSAKKKMEDTNTKKYGVKCIFSSNKIKEKIVKSNINIRGVSNPAHDPNVIKKRLETYKKNHMPKNPVTDENVLEIFENIKNKNLLNEINRNDVYFNIKYFGEFIKSLYLKKNRKIRIYEIGEIFERHNRTVQEKLKKLHLMQYIDVKDSELELKFKKFLIDNGFKENFDFERHNRSVLSENQSELDFYLKDLNIAFEINDIQSHNVKRKDQYYHYNKTLQCLKKEIKLIHIWEWELTDPVLWRCTSNWILNLLNPSKIQLTLSDCTIKEVSLEEQEYFLNEYNLTGYTTHDYCIGLYHNSDLIQVLSFDNNELTISTKFGYNIIDDYTTLINDNILLIQDISKSTNVPSNFKLLKYVAPQKVCNDVLSSNEYKKMYDCGQNIYVLERK